MGGKRAALLTKKSESFAAKGNTFPYPSASLLIANGSLWTCTSFLAGA